MMAMAQLTAFKMDQTVKLGGGAARWTATGELALARVIELSVALLLTVEFVIVFLGVVSRYLLHSPLVWVDELASTLFMWLAVLGSVIAFRRSEHMRMSVLVDKLPPRASAFLDLVATATTLSFLVFLLPAGVEGAMDDRDLLTLALEISSAWRSAALPVGAALMIIFGFLHLARFRDRLLSLAAIVSTVGLVAAAVFLKPVFADLGQLNLLIFFMPDAKPQLSEATG